MWRPRDCCRLEVSPGFLLLACILLYLDEGVGVLPWGLLACTIHELGHMAAARTVGGRVERLSLSAVGAEFRFAYPSALSYGKESFVTLAGPMANLLTGVVALWADAYLLAVFSMGVGIFNLLPILPLDGGVVLFNLLLSHAGFQWADRVLAVTAGVLIGLLLGAGVVAAVAYTNLTLLLTAFWLLLGVLRQGKSLHLSAKKRVLP